jgi:GNAT superfamily N-acetyltransferase
MSQQFTIRRATASDVETIAGHRARMFDEMGDVPPGGFETLRAKSRECLPDLLNRGEYIGWLASPAQGPEIIAGGAGVHVRRVLPHPVSNDEAHNRIADGRHATVINVFTHPAWRRQGVALLLLRQIIDWARTEKLDCLVLHASKEGRSLYERLGFVPTNEMRLVRFDSSENNQE